MALRQTTGFVESVLHLIGLDWAVPDFSTLSRRQKTLKVNIPFRGSDGPLHLLVDSTGIKVEGEGEWPFAGKTIPRIVFWPGSYASTAPRNGVSGARSTSDLMNKRWKSARPSSPPAMSAMSSR
jgi:hypothetical protein